MNFTKINAEHIAYFKTICNSKEIVETTAISFEKYTHDETEDLNYPPDIVLKPHKVAQISKILAYCNKYKIAVTTRGAGTGLSGGALAVYGGVCLSMENFNQILHIDENNLQVTTEPGVITEVLQNAVKEKGLFYPPDPASKGSCYIGGNVAENAGGPKALKYGVTNKYVLNLEVVLPDGSVAWTGANVLKNATGYNLTQLFTGSEGTLGIITKIVLSLIPHPKYDLTLLAPFLSAKNACKAVAAIFKAGFTPSALEFIERDALNYTLQFKPDIALKIPENVNAHLLIEVDGNHADILQKECMDIAELLEDFDCGEILFAQTQSEKDRLWQMRRIVAEAVKSQSVYKEEDTVVPRYYLPELLEKVKDIGNKYNFKSACYGHAGDGNLHVNILKGNATDQHWQKELPKALRELFTYVKQLGGTISGEHGIGWVQKEFMNIVYTKQQIAQMKAIKSIFDKNQILNRGKIFD